MVDLRIDPKSGYMPQTMRNHVKTAYNYCGEHGLTECKVNTMEISFDFARSKGEVKYKQNGETLCARFSFREVG